MLDEPLFVNGLIAIRSPQLVDRYNVALSQLGILPTQLESFHLDSMGWSPEIAEERQDRYYLSHGEANPLAIIISPDQAYCETYAPLCSLDETVLQAFYKTHALAIADICRISALWLDLDQGIIRYQHPSDLLLISQLVVTASAGELTLNAKAQASMVKHFLDDPMAWFHEDFRQRIIESARDHDDLRHRSLLIPNLHFYEVDDFYADIFGGVFCLKLSKTLRRQLIMVDRQQYERYGKHSQKITFIDDDKLIDLLRKETLLDVDLRGYRENPRALRRKYSSMVAAAICHLEPEIDLLKLSQPQIKKIMTDLASQLPPLLFELERLLLKLEAGRSIRVEQLSKPLMMVLLHPHAKVKRQQRKVLLRLLNHWQSFDAVQLFKTDKARFFMHYADWTKVQKRWFIGQLD